jgi:hypothetical protein
MSSANPPYPYFNGITYNNAYFETSGTGLSRTQATALYLQKTTPDTATALETFNTGIKTNTINAVSTSLDIVANLLGINPNSGGATTNIHTNNSSSNGTVNIMGSVGGSSGRVNVCVGSGGGVTASECNISTGTTIGTVSIGNSANAVNINSMALSLGTATKTLTIQTPITVGYTTNPSASNQIGYVINDTINATTIAPNTGVNTFTTNVTLPAGVWLITYGLRLEPTAGTSTATLCASYIVDNALQTYATNSTSNLTSITINPNQGWCSTGSYVMKSTGSTTYNVGVYIIYSGGTNFGFLKTGVTASYVQRTRIG